MLNNFVYPILFSYAIMASISTYFVALFIALTSSYIYNGLLNMYDYLNNLSCNTVIYIHCILSVCSTATICLMMVHKYNQEMDALIKEHIVMEIVEESQEQNPDDELEENVREALDKIADLGLLHNMQKAVTMCVDFIIGNY